MFFCFAIFGQVEMLDLSDVPPADDAGFAGGLTPVTGTSSSPWRRFWRVSPSPLYVRTQLSVALISETT